MRIRTMIMVISRWGIGTRQRGRIMMVIKEAPKDRVDQVQVRLNTYNDFIAKRNSKYRCELMINRERELVSE